MADETDLGVPGATYRIGDLLDRSDRVGAGRAAALRLRRHAARSTRSSLAEPLSAGDAFEITGDHDVTVTAAVPTQLLVWSFAG